MNDWMVIAIYAASFLALGGVCWVGIPACWGIFESLLHLPDYKAIERMTGPGEWPEDLDYGNKDVAL